MNRSDSEDQGRNRAAGLDGFCEMDNNSPGKAHDLLPAADCFPDPDPAWLAWSASDPNNDLETAGLDPESPGFTPEATRSSAISARVEPLAKLTSNASGVRSQSRGQSASQAGKRYLSEGPGAPLTLEQL